VNPTRAMRLALVVSLPFLVGCGDVERRDLVAPQRRDDYAAEIQLLLAQLAIPSEMAQPRS